MKVKAALNKSHPLKRFVYGKVRFAGEQIHVEIQPRKNSQGECGECGRRGPTYDTARTPRMFEFVPILGFATFFVYAMRRIDCPTCGVKTERVPWADGKNHYCNVYRLFLARWARRLPWSEVAAIFGTTWNVVYRSISWVVEYGLEQRRLDNIRSIGVDEVAIWKGHKYLTVVYQIDEGLRRLLWVGRERTEETLIGFFDMLGKERSRTIEFVASDMWKPYLNVIGEKLSNALHVLDRFHIVSKLNKAIDEIRAQEARQLKTRGFEPVLKRTRWCFLKRPENMTENQTLKLNDILQYNLRTVRAYLLKESFDAFWTYTSPYWAGWYLDKWCARAMKSRLAPIKKFVGTLREHRELLLNWFKAKKEISSGVVEP
ncbi:MAG: ISL3 family transposase [Deltaproteobacteria bacterium]|nr:ISL3 family transposase [Deltaproteobacteria bacterium]